jgi:hypothetical protein
VTQAAAGPDTSRSSGNSPLRWWVLVLAAIAVSSLEEARTGAAV